MVDTQSNQIIRDKLSDQSKSQKILLGVLIFFIFAFSVITMLDYFKVFSVYSIVNIFNPKEVVVVSENNNIQLIAVDKQKLLNYLNEYRFFEYKKIRVVKRIEHVTAKKLEIILTSNPVNEYPIRDSSGVIRYAGEATFNDNDSTLTLKIYMSPNYIQDTSEDGLAKVISALALYILYDKTTGFPFNNPTKTFSILKSSSEKVHQGGAFLQVSKK